MPVKERLTEVAAILREAKMYESLDGLFAWDEEQFLPAEGQGYREEMLSFFAGKAGMVFLTEEAGRCAKFFADYDPSKLGSDIERGQVRQFLRFHRDKTRVPVELQQKMAALSAKGLQQWQKARRSSDYGMMKDLYREIFDMKKRMAEHIDPHAHPLTVLAGMIDEGIDVSEVDRLFAELRAGIIGLTKKIGASGVEVDDACIRQPVDKEALRSFVRSLVEGMGFDPSRSCYGEVQHPVSIQLGPRDARVTTNYETFRQAVWGMIHETGHSMYSYRARAEVVAAHLWDGLGGGMHESQSRFYENMIGRSKEFWQHFYPETQERFPHLRAVSLDEFYRAVNKVAFTLNRITSDEVTYSLHPILRFELEKELLEGRVGFEALPEAWNDKMEEYLGIRPNNDQEGCLQDVHWSCGLIGYFQSYALGNLYGGQFRSAMLKDIPGVYGEVAKGNFVPLNDWLTEKIHQHGHVYCPAELIRRVTGEKLASRYFLEYLSEKTASIYGI